MNSVVKEVNSLSENIMLTTESVSAEVLETLVNGKILIVRIKNFIGKDACSDISASLKNHGYNDYLNAPRLGRIGMSYFETGLNQELVDLYFKTALENIDSLRKTCYPHPYPIDIFRCIMDEQWPKGCTLQTLYDKKMFVGLSRCVKPGIPLLAHHDMFARHAPNTPESNSLISQFGINVYVDMPETGGEFAMWMKEISDAEFLERRGTKYGIDLDLLGAPDFTVKPDNGDLMLFNARKLHAVLPGSGSDRLTISAFFGYRGDDQPLTVWS